jgi:hypothetical protein
MSDPVPPSRIPSWFSVSVLALLALQTGLIWIQGGLLNRQRGDIQGLREDIQYLTDSLDQNLIQEPVEEGSYDPTRRPLPRSKHFIQRARMMQEAPPPTEEERTRKELEAARESTQKALSDAREAQSKLSIEENIRKAEEKKQLEAAGNTWQKWLWVALGAGVLAMVVRSWLRRRG